MLVGVCRTHLFHYRKKIMEYLGLLLKEILIIKKYEFHLPPLLSSSTLPLCLIPSSFFFSIF